MSWGSELWDQYDQICGHTEQSVEFIKRVQSFLKERIHAEQVYAKELRKVVKSFKKKDEEDSKYTCISAFGKMVVETNDLAGQRELIAEYLQNEVLKPLQDLAKNTLSERRKLMGNGVELHKELKESMEVLERNKRIYLKSSEEKEAAAHALEKADNDPQSTKAKIDKLTQVSRSKDQTAEDNRNNYILQLESTNEFRRAHYTQKMPSLMDRFMGLNTNHINEYKRLIAAYAECHRRVHPVINTCLNNITASSEAIDTDKDNGQFIGERKTGYPVPGDVDFEEYQGKIKKKEKKEDKKKFEARDFSHLPPEQRRKKLIKKITELEALHNKLTSDVTAMEKMRGIYEKNPSLGDPKQVAQQLVETQDKIELTTRDIEEFRTYLSQAEGGSGSSTLSGATATNSPRQSSFRNGKNKSPGEKKKKGKDKDKPKLNSNDFEIIPNDTASYTTPKGSIENIKGSGGKEWFSDDEGTSGGPDGPSDDFTNMRRGTMLYDFAAQNEDELSCNHDDEVIILEDLNDGWLRVQRGSEKGFVPQSYVQL